MVKKRKKVKLHKPKITFDRLGQIIFTFKEVGKLAMRIKPKLLLAVLVLNAIWGVSAVPTFYLEKLILDTLIQAVGNPDWKPVFYLAMLFVSLALIVSLGRNFLGSFNRYLRRTLSRYFDAETEVLIGNKLTQLSLATIESPEFRDRFNKVEKESSRRAWGLMMPLSDIPNYLAGFLSSAAVLMFVHPLLSVGVLLVSLPRFLVNQKFIKKGYALHTELSPKRRIWSWITHYLTRNRNFMEMKILGISDLLTSKARLLFTEIIEKRVKLNKKREMSSFLTFLPLTLYELSVSVFLVFWVVIGRITVGSFQLYLRSLRSAEQNLSGLVSSLLEIYENYIYVTDLVWFLNLEPEVEVDSKKIVPGTQVDIKFDDVWFKYQRQQKWVIKGVNFSVKPGEKIALVGENGAGKSTLIKLLAGFYIPPKGDVLIGGHSTSEINLGKWRERMAVLFQEFEPYPFSVRESIGYGDVSRLDRISEIKEAARKTGADKFVEDLPKKYDNPLMPEIEGGIRPSTGQWQRIGISRMLFRKNASILILDEPTSNVDPEAEEKIFRELVKITKDKILIFVTQRFSTVRIADRIFVMHKGKIVENGTHKQLIKKDGKYARLYNLQAQAYLSNK
jgi:ABC-type multidrug transport system fused ATPase/permease subunit